MNKNIASSCKYIMLITTCSDDLLDDIAFGDSFEELIIGMEDKCEKIFFHKIYETKTGKLISLGKVDPKIIKDNNEEREMLNHGILQKNKSMEVSHE